MKPKKAIRPRKHHTIYDVLNPTCSCIKSQSSTFSSIRKLSHSKSTMSRVALAQIPSLTFYQDAETASRRGNPIPQLTCIGQACRLYTPEVVRCTSIGGSGTDVDWKVSLDHLSYFKAQPLTPSLLVRSRSARSFALRTSGSVLRGVVWSR